jgi:acyl dehydratase
MQNKPIPFSLALEQRQHLAALAQTSVAKAIPFVRKWHSSASDVWLNDEIEAPRAALIDSYLQWAHVPEHQQNCSLVPAHMFSQWSVPLAMRVLLHNQYGLANLVNLGCDIKINGTLLPGEKLLLSGELVSVNENPMRTALSVKVVTRTRRNDRAIEALIHCMLPKQALPAQTVEKTGTERQWETAGAWAVDGYDGLRFALLTGDFNPVHWADAVAKHSPFKQKVLHGFASLSLSWAALQAREPADQDIQRISAKFARPVPLPSSSMYVFRSAPRASGSRRYELKNTRQQVFLMGEYSVRGG